MKINYLKFNRCAVRYLFLTFFLPKPPVGFGKKKVQFLFKYYKGETNYVMLLFFKISFIFFSMSHNKSRLLSPKVLDRGVLTYYIVMWVISLVMFLFVSHSRASHCCHKPGTNPDTLIAIKNFQMEKPSNTITDPKIEPGAICSTVALAPTACHRGSLVVFWLGHLTHLKESPCTSELNKAIIRGLIITAVILIITLLLL